ncbi:aminopeptidase N [Anabrus simplex]|uniref:aminopeptidase N n=1 Tax=Anabrus simplex TaxID=316456 RepID=UPI0035A3118E
MLSTTSLFLWTVVWWSAAVSGDSSYLLSPAETPKPRTYTIWLSPDLESSTFTGNVSIAVTATSSPSDKIVLHSASITIGSIVVRDEAGADLYKDHQFDTAKDFLIIALNTNLQANSNYTIDIEYQGILHDDMYGFYKSTYVADDGKIRNIAATQFQPTHARKAFPCFDEPRYKAKFAITIDTPAGYHSLSNTLDVDYGESDISTRRDVAFEETPVMSTYLVAFIVSDFEYLFTTSDGILFRSWARSNAVSGTKYSVDISPSIVNAMEEFTNVPYSHSGLDKVDQVALPDFSAGAMENWGLITYRETALLFQSAVNTASNKQRVATVIGHEIVHMWFGNLVTTEWWNSTWLNEGFARYFQYYSASKVETDWRLMEQFVVNEHQSIFGTDALPSAHALTSECYTPAEVSAMFSGLTYSKGGSILRMLSHSLSEKTFQSALRTYLLDRQFDTVTPDDLITHLLSAVEADNSLPPTVNAQSIVESWTEQPGFPVVTVQRCYDDNTAIISQKRFLLNQGESSDLLWKIPISWATEETGFSNTAPTMWLTIAQETILSGLPAADKWVIFNVQEAGYYRVNYDEDNWNMIVAALNSNHTIIHPLNRAQLVDDALNLARAGQLSYQTALTLIGYLKDEVDYIPWASANTALNFLNQRLVGHADYSYFKAYILELISKVYENLGFEDTENHVDRLHRSIVLTWACNMDHAGCNENVDRKLSDLVESGTKVEPDLQNVVYCTGLRNGNYDSWQFLWNQYKTSLDFSEKTLILSVLGCTKNETTLQEYLLKSIDNTGDIRRQDASSVFSAVYANPTGVNVALEFLKSNFEAISNYYGSMGAIGNIVRGIAAQISTQDQLQKLREFVNENNEALGTAGDAALQTATENLSWSATHQEVIFAYLKGENVTSSTPSIPSSETPDGSSQSLPSENVTSSTPSIPSSETPDGSSQSLPSVLITCTCILVGIIVQSR